MSKKLEIEKMKAEMAFEEKNMVLAYALWFFLGGLGVHRFYLGKMGTGITMLLICVFGWLTLGAAYFVLGIWWLVDAYFVHKYVTEHNNEMKMKKIEHISNVSEDSPVVESEETTE